MYNTYNMCHLPLSNFWHEWFKRWHNDNDIIIFLPFIMGAKNLCGKFSINSHKILFPDESSLLINGKVCLKMLSSQIFDLRINRCQHMVIFFVMFPYNRLAMIHEVKSERLQETIPVNIIALQWFPLLINSHSFLIHILQTN